MGTEVYQDYTYPQMPVDFTQTVTSPGLSLCPDLTSSRDGSHSEIQSSCSGLVKTPTFGLEGVDIVIVEFLGGFGSFLAIWVNC